MSAGGTRRSEGSGPARGRPLSRLRGGSAVGLLLALVIVAFGAWLFVEVADDEAEGVDFGVSTADILADPDEHYGEVVVVSGQIRERLGAAAFTIGAGELRVVAADELPGEAGEGDVVQVVGEVRPLAASDADEQAGADLDDELFGGLQELPAIYAEGVVLEPVEQR